MSEQEDIDAAFIAFVEDVAAAFEKYCMTKYIGDGDDNSSVVFPTEDWVFLGAYVNQEGRRQAMTLMSPTTPLYAVMGLLHTEVAKLSGWAGSKLSENDND